VSSADNKVKAGKVCPGLTEHHDRVNALDAASRRAFARTVRHSVNTAGTAAVFRGVGTLSLHGEPWN